MSITVVGRLKRWPAFCAGLSAVLFGTLLSAMPMRVAIAAGTGPVCQSDLTTACVNYSGTYQCPLQLQSCNVRIITILPPKIGYQCPADKDLPCLGDSHSCSPVQCVPRPQCSDGIDNDGDGKTDYPADPGCTAPTDSNEVDPPACSDGIDNDGDGKIDYPNDPGCSSATDTSEQDIPQCSDGIDNDGDGKTDYPNDPGCSSASDNSEVDPPACSDGIDNDGDGKIDYPTDPGCSSSTDTNEYNPPQCNDGIDNDGDGKVDYPNDPGCSTPLDDSELDPPACSDGIDNDGDGKIDFPNDPGCSSASDTSEEDPRQCNDGIDNDGDGKVDYPNDPDCASPTDDSEAPPPACNDGIDNDGDGKIDGADPGCSSPFDTDEADNKPQCSDGDDNDRDGKIDYPDDDGCSSPTDNSEAPQGIPCSNCTCGVDLDGNGDVSGANETASCVTTSTGTAQCPLQETACTKTAAGGYVCPVDGSLACEDVAGKQMCSPNACYPSAQTTTDVNQPEPTDDGPRDANGQCLGVLRLFSGQGMRCRTSGTQTAFQDCCTNHMAKLEDTMGAKGEPSQREYKTEKSDIQFWANQCDIQDQKAALLNDSDYCVYIGKYCAEKWVFGCVQHAKSYCCFGSKLAKMIQEQGRPQIPAMGGFGTPEHPSCEGFTLEQFQALDFTKIDLSGYYASFRYESQQMMQTNLQNNVQTNTPH